MFDINHYSHTNCFTTFSHTKLGFRWRISSATELTNSLPCRWQEYASSELGQNNIDCLVWLLKCVQNLSSNKFNQFSVYSTFVNQQKHATTEVGKCRIILRMTQHKKAFHLQQIEVSINAVTPKWLIYNRKSQSKVDDGWGYPYFRKFSKYQQFSCMFVSTFKNVVPWQSRGAETQKSPCRWEPLERWSESAASHQPDSLGTSLSSSWRFGRCKKDNIPSPIKSHEIPSNHH